MNDLTEDEKLTVASYDKHARVWAKKYISIKYYKNEYKEFHQLLPEGRVIDIGAGAGRDAVALVGLGYEYVGVDISEKLLEIARKREPKAKLLVQSIYDLSFDDKFDGFWCTAMLLHVPKERIGEALHSIKSVLRPSAIGFLTIKDGQGSEMENYEIEKGVTLKRFYQYWSREEFSQLLVKNGFEILDYKYRPDNPRQRWHCFFVKLK